MSAILGGAEVAGTSLPYAWRASYATFFRADLAKRAIWAVLGIALLGAPVSAWGQEIASTDVREVCGWVNGQSYSQRHRVVWRPGMRGFELDHIIPLALGGADTDKNIHAQPLDEARAKDQFEVWSWRAVCHGQVPLATAQGWFIGDWADAMREHMR
jgi:hypothetical protein